jgi:hypothetical protein
MNRLVSFAASLLLLSSMGLAWAQDTATVAENATPAITPIFNEDKPHLKELVGQLKLQTDRVEAGVANGNITENEAAALRLKLKAMRDELRADVMQKHQNGLKLLPDDQIQRLKSELEANSMAIHDKK